MTMADDGTAFAAIAETTSFLNDFNNLPDYRQAGKVDYPLPEVLLLSLLAVLAGAEARPAAEVPALPERHACA
jgi:hypothetical protein